MTDIQAHITLFLSLRCLRFAQLPLFALALAEVRAPATHPQRTPHITHDFPRQSAILSTGTRQRKRCAAEALRAAYRPGPHSTQHSGQRTGSVPHPQRTRHSTHDFSRKSANLSAGTRQRKRCAAEALRAAYRPGIRSSLDLCGPWYGLGLWAVRVRRTERARDRAARQAERLSTARRSRWMPKTL